MRSRRRVRILVGVRNVLLDDADELRHVLERVATEAFVRQITEPALDQVEPRA